MSNEQSEEEDNKDGDDETSKFIQSRTGIGEMGNFLKDYPQYSEFQYKWNLSVEKRILLLVDASRMEYSTKKKKKKEKEEETVVSTGSMKDFFGSSASHV
jgi:hypothetical protein